MNQALVANLKLRSGHMMLFLLLLCWSVWICWWQLGRSKASTRIHRLSHHKGFKLRGGLLICWWQLGAPGFDYPITSASNCGQGLGLNHIITRSSNSCFFLSVLCWICWRQLDSDQGRLPHYKGFKLCQGLYKRALPTC